MPWQPLAIRYPNAVKTVAAALKTLLFENNEPDVWVGYRLPKIRPSRAIQVIRDGGAASELRDKPRLRVLCWDKTDEKADDLASLVVALMPLLVLEGVALKVEHLSGPYEIPEATPCRYLLFEVHTRGEAL